MMQETYYLHQGNEYFPSNIIAIQSNISCSIDFETTIMPYNHHQPQLSNNSSTSDEPNDQGCISIINERKYRRMVSNRESARRSRLRKQRQLEELCSQVKRLVNENHGLLVKVNQLSESHERIIEENRKLKNERLELRKLLSDAQLDNTYTTLGDLADDGDHVDGGDGRSSWKGDDGGERNFTMVVVEVDISCRSLIILLN
ncbi:basic leucine zipper 43-like [Rutidosis leptorrhynchoides]|uniref:basic leucine zipper 43-like n=1 Tax=Rutidosis leptorrhynchoides TaxID=125765 RepID=UPI003A9A544D